MDRSAMYHVGVVVADLQVAKHRLGELLELTWGPDLDATAVFFDGEGRDVPVRLQYCHSTEPPYLELLQEVRGTPWVCNEHSNLHHIGYFAHDVDAGSHRLTRAGCPFELGIRSADGGPLVFAYHRDELAVRIELTSESRRPTIEGVYVQRVDPA